jgi:hypothetical protein
MLSPVSNAGQRMLLLLKIEIGVVILVEITLAEIMSSSISMCPHSLN